MTDRQRIDVSCSSKADIARDCVADSSFSRRSCAVEICFICGSTRLLAGGQAREANGSCNVPVHRGLCSEELENAVLKKTTEVTARTSCKKALGLFMDTGHTNVAGSPS